ncbi:MAG TPA: LLM class flavin-dependent oxidoreductase [Ktedonobacteraceae bacterium]|nr:LLM class flavin-dependent oxidoreductase [Ktedonobacteraceae bacterium]
MDIGIGLPAAIPATPGTLILNWARKADEGPFSSLGLIDRLVFSNYSPLIALTAAGAVTLRVRLVTTVLLAPLFNTGVLAKELASIDALTRGRLTVGVGVGARKDDFLAAPASFEGRGKKLDGQLDEFRRIWAGDRLSAGVGPIGPQPVQPGGPPVLIGGRSPVALRRVAHPVVAGFISGSGGPAAARQHYDTATKVWNDAGRPGRPRFVACSYYGIGPDAIDTARSYLTNYYGAQYGETIVKSLPVTPPAIKETIRAYRDIGADELILWPTSMFLEQVDNLADIVSEFTSLPPAIPPPFGE